MKENRKLLKEVLRDIQKDMTDAEVLALLADSRVSVNEIVCAVVCLNGFFH